GRGRRMARAPEKLEHRLVRTPRPGLRSRVPRVVRRAARAVRDRAEDRERPGHVPLDVAAQDLRVHGRGKGDDRLRLSGAARSARRGFRGARAAGRYRCMARRAPSARATDGTRAARRTGARRARGALHVDRARGERARRARRGVAGRGDRACRLDRCGPACARGGRLAAGVARNLHRGIGERARIRRGRARRRRKIITGSSALPQPNRGRTGFKIEAAWILALLVASGAVLRLVDLGAISFHWDEDLSSLAAKAIAEHGIPELPSGMIYLRGLAFSYAMAASGMWLGFDETALRLPAALFGIALIPLCFAFGKRLFGTPVGLVLAALVTFSFWDIEFSRYARMYAAFGFFYLLTLLLIWRYR